MTARTGHPDNRVALEHERMTQRAKKVTAEDRAEYRRRHPECVTPFDSVVDALIELEQMGGRASRQMPAEATHGRGA